MQTAIVWFRRDLRLADHPALLAAAEAERVVPLFVVDDRIGATARREPRAAFLLACAAALGDRLEGRLVVRRGDPTVIVPAVAEEVGATAVHVSEDFSPYGSRRDDAVDASLEARGRALARTGSPYAVPPGVVRTQAGGAYAVFTPFSRAWRAHRWPDPAPAPTGVAWAEGLVSDPLPGFDPSLPLPEPGEEAAHARLDHFLSGAVAEYHERRDQPGVDGTSRLSPYLKAGCIHPRQILSRLPDGAGPATFATELCWRDFYADVLWHRPASAWEPLQERIGRIRTDAGEPAERKFAAWAEGSTGYPIVDAGMRQLRAEGWMHNRVRMIVASFLVKDLHLPWQWGARHFLRWLVDGDVASNNHGWQWTAGTGTDAAPYFRIFNPVAQSTRFDPSGAYIRRYVPELAGLTAREIHEPWRRPGGPPVGYPAPIVDHAVERAEALRRYEAVKGG